MTITYYPRYLTAVAGPNDDELFPTCADDVAVCSAVYLSAANTVAKADATSITTMPVYGFCVTRPTSGTVSVLNGTPTAGGSGYTASDVLTITTGGSGATLTVDTVDGSGAVTAVTLVTGGLNYTSGAGKVTTGGTGAGCTVNITTTVGTATVRTDGQLAGFGTLTADTQYFASAATAGAVTATAPSSTNNVRQGVGRAVTTDILEISVDDEDYIVIA
jgi:hypothetical protein